MQMICYPLIRNVVHILNFKYQNIEFHLQFQLYGVKYYDRQSWLILTLILYAYSYHKGIKSLKPRYIVSICDFRTLQLKFNSRSS